MEIKRYKPLRQWAEAMIMKQIPNEAIKVNGLIFTTRMGVEYPVEAVDYLDGIWVAYVLFAAGVCRFSFQTPPCTSLKEAK